MRTPTLRAQLLLVLLAIIALSTTMVGLLAYQTSSHAVQDDAIRFVAMAADSRHQALDRELHNQHDRAESFLEAAMLGCTEWDRPELNCLRKELSRFMKEENSVYGVIQSPLIAPVRLGEIWGDTPDPEQFSASQLAVVQVHGGSPYFFLRAQLADGSSIGLRQMPLHMAAIFNGSGLGHLGSSFLVNVYGDSITGIPHHNRIDTGAMRDCLAKKNGEVIAPDYDGKVVVMGFRYVPQIGGGCIMAHMEKAEAFAPVVKLRDRIASVSILLAIIATVLGVLFSDHLRKAIQVLEVGTRAIDSGDFKMEVPRGAPREFHDFARLLRSISHSLKDRSRKLTRLNERLQRAHEAGRIASWEWNILTGEVLWSGKPAEVYGHSGDDFATTFKKFLAIIHEEDLDRVHDEIQRAVAEGNLRTEHRVVASDGSERWIAVRAQTFYGEAGSALRMVGTSIDVTDRKLAEEALRKTEKLAAAGRLAATIAHEVNNPLEAATNLLYLAKSTDSLQAAQAYVTMAEQELDRVTQITKQTLGFYRETSAPQVLELAPIVDSVAKLFRRRAEQKGISLEVELTPGSEIVASAGEMKQVVANFLSNSIDACGRSGRIHVRLRKNRDRVILFFADNGTGIASVNRAKIFEPFFTTKRDVGTGLGLWVSREIVEKHGGSIRMFSSTRPEHSGTVFAIVFPSVKRIARVSA